MKHKEALESVNFSLREVQLSILALDRKIKKAEDVIQNADKGKDLKMKEGAAIAVCNFLSEVSMKNNTSLFGVMDRQIQAAHQRILVTEREKARLLPKEKLLIEQKALIEAAILKRANRVRKHKEEKMQAENPNKKAKDTSKLKTYDELVRNLRLLRDGKRSSEFFLVEGITPAQKAKELDCVKGLILQNNEWFKENSRNLPEFKEKLTEAEYLYKCLVKLK